MSEDSLVAELVEELEQIPTVDAHEHLPTEAEHLEKPGPDFFSLFEHYCQNDMRAAGASPEDLAFLADRDQPLEERWERFSPLLDAIRTGSYARAALITMRDLLEVEELNEATYPEVGERLKDLRQSGEYDRVLRERCNIQACIECWQLDAGELPDYFYHLAPSPEVVDLFCREDLCRLADSCDHPIHTLHDVLECMDRKVERWASNPRVVGVKVGQAYQRSLAFQKVTRTRAERAFNRLLTNEQHVLSNHEALSLQDFLLFHLMARADAAGLVMVFHTGLQAGNCNRIRNSDPLHLQPLLEEFPEARVDLFHGGMPWVRQVAVLAKYFPGVHLNMAWMHIISPEQSCSALSEWLDMVPCTKIFGFGGDYGIVENVYGHLTMARENVARVLAQKLRSGAWPRWEATRVGRLLMRENPRRFYRLAGE